MQAKLFIDILNSPIDTEKLSVAVYKKLSQVENLSAEVILVSEEEIKNLNREQRGIDSITDVLSFPTLSGHKNMLLKKNNYPFDVDEEGRLFIGSIAVCLKRAKEQAEEYGHSEEREITYLICHGLLHLFGFDHLTDEEKGEMRLIEEEILTEIGIKR
ncbi:MAG: rRNA maturation RNase YbeY [Clostridia bacterium]|nr:rRNA maturation RNase YbeY [Clostridia bacterium]